ncbi:DEAD/DEAH box helicase [Spirosoma rhododendri]|uniref:DEAD-box ATP-dependent RNA helicase RhpA n=1 Tax=Spirosoma rhododendri TaxID=2728024 RepID=A0A7L5DVL9_9BACT|nr:DEAD/DEAH box helicase [Spirosoma rhododendri]QJD80648.1 DEAD/DEAH box helicase [Spirosoma rhododendri]
MQFTDLELIDPILAALTEEGYSSPTPIQQQAIPLLLNRRDLLGCAQTGTGKTAAFAIPILQLLTADKAKQANAPRRIKTLVLTPTRELAIQIDESFAAYGRHLNMKHTVIFGGVSQHSQVNTIRSGIDILVATPGRLLDLMNQGIINLRDVQYFVLDEADRMLDMGFIHDVKRVIAKLPERRQSLFFSATMPPDVAKLADTILNNPAKVEVTPVSSTADTIQQAMYFVSKDDKRKLLTHILEDSRIKSVLVFARTKHGADRVAKDLVKAGIQAEAIHGNKSQNARQRALTNFKSRETRVLVATDIAARGIDVDELSHVINYELPNIPETYVHRIGRTGRAGHDGIALSFCDEEETEYLRDIHKLIGKKVPVIEEHPYVLNIDASTVTPKAPQQQRGQGRGQRPQQQRSGNGNRPSGQQSRSNEQRSDAPSGQRSQSNSRPSSGQGRSGQGGPAGGRSESGRDNRNGQSNDRRDSRNSNSQPQSNSRRDGHPNQSGRPNRDGDEKPSRGTGNSRYLDFSNDKNY